MSEIFISYARSTAAKAQQIAEALRGLGYGVWRDDELPAHRSYAEVIQERLNAAKAVVVVWSAEAVKSEWVQSEADRARTERKLVQLSVDGAPLPMPFDRIQCADLSGWNGNPGAAGWRKVSDSFADLLRGVAPAPVSPQPKDAATHRASICVLPFANMSDDPQQEYFSDGISEDIITDLSKVSALFVTARNTAFTYKGRSVKVPEVARELSVSHVLEGSVRKAGRRLRITAQLIEGEAGGHVWAERYDRDLDDIFALQDEISEAIVKALKLKLLPEEKQAIERRGTDSVDAYNLFLMARSYWLTSAADRQTQETIERLCRRATEIDPGYAQAWALLAVGQNNLQRVFGLGAGGDAALDRALALNPDLAEARALNARRLSNAGHQEEARAEIAAALKLDPESYEVNYRAGGIFYQQRRLAEAVPYYERAASLIETEVNAVSLLISCYAALDDRENLLRIAHMALARAEKALAQDRSNGTAMETGVGALAVLGEAERAKEWIERALLISPDVPQIRYNFACTLVAALNDPDAALAMLGPLLEADSGYLVRGALTDPDLDSLRDDPRFQAMIATAEARLAAAKPDGANAEKPG